MGIVNRMASELGISETGLRSFNGQQVYVHRCVPSIEQETALTSSTTFYSYVAIAPCAMQFAGGSIRVKANGVASGTIDILKVPSGTATSSGTAMATQLTGNGFTANTNRAIAALTTSAINLNAGDTVVVKIVTQGTETLTPPIVSLYFKV